MFTLGDELVLKKFANCFSDFGFQSRQDVQEVRREGVGVGSDPAQVVGPEGHQKQNSRALPKVSAAQSGSLRAIYARNTNFMSPDVARQ
jgi:hypothetical protein